MAVELTISGCAICKCKHWDGENCNDPNDYVDAEGQPVCGRVKGAILVDDSPLLTTLPED